MKDLKRIAYNCIFLFILTGTNITIKAELSHAQPSKIIFCKAKLFQDELVGTGNIEYYGKLECTIGVPKTIKLVVYESNVNFPNKWWKVETKEFTCPAQPVCLTPYYTLPINRTKFLRVKGYFSGITTNGNIESTEKNSSDIVYNDRGEPYPKYKVSTKVFLQGYVPFPKLAPGRSYDRCDDDPSRTTPPACKRKNIKKLLINHYTNAQQIPLPGPIDNIEGHHVKPLRWGGGNSITNGVLLPEDVHKHFSRWWTGFSSRKW